MEIFSNRQNKPSSRDKSFFSGKRSGSDCASQKKKKLIAEKLAVRFSINKKILTKNKAEAADRSTDRVQGTPNPKISSAPKPVSTAAVRRGEGDADAQKQPEPELKKNSSPKGKKMVEEVAKKDEAAEDKTQLCKKGCSKNIPTKVLELSMPVLKDKLGDTFDDTMSKISADTKELMGELTTNVKRFVEKKDDQLSAWVKSCLSSDKVKKLEGKRREVEILRLKADRERYALLKEEIGMHLHDLEVEAGTSDKNKRSV